MAYFRQSSLIGMPASDSFKIDTIDALFFFHIQILFCFYHSEFSYLFAVLFEGIFTLH